MPSEEYQLRNTTRLEEVHDFFARMTNEEQGGMMFVLLGDSLLSWCNEAVVAEHAGNVVGAATLTFDGVEKNGKRELVTVYVSKLHRKKGLAFRLCNEAVRRFFEIDRSPVYCTVKREAIRRVLTKVKENLPLNLRELVKVELSLCGDNDVVLFPE